MMLIVPHRRTIGAIHQEIINKENVPSNIHKTLARDEQKQTRLQEANE